jgi:hypothetical protein
LVPTVGLHLADLHAPLDELRTSGVDVRHDKVQDLHTAGRCLHDPGSEPDRAGRPRRRQHHDANLVGHLVVEIDVEPDLLDVNALARSTSDTSSSFMPTTGAFLFLIAGRSSPRRPSTGTLATLNPGNRSGKQTLAHLTQ